VTSKADIYSAGITIGHYLLQHRLSPDAAEYLDLYTVNNIDGFRLSVVAEIEKKLQNKRLLPSTDVKTQHQWSTALKLYELVSQMCQDDAEERPSASRLLENDVFKNNGMRAEKRN
jgi:hypothetical protein